MINSELKNLQKRIEAHHHEVEHPSQLLPRREKGNTSEHKTKSVELANPVWPEEFAMLREYLIQKKYLIQADNRKYYIAVPHLIVAIKSESKGDKSQAQRSKFERAKISDIREEDSTLIIVEGKPMSGRSSPQKFYSEVDLLKIYRYFHAKQNLYLTSNEIEDQSFSSDQIDVLAEQEVWLEKYNGVREIIQKKQKRDLLIFQGKRYLSARGIRSLIKPKKETSEKYTNRVLSKLESEEIVKFFAGLLSEFEVRSILGMLGSQVGAGRSLDQNMKYYTMNELFSILDLIGEKQRLYQLY